MSEEKIKRLTASQDIRDVIFKALCIWTLGHKGPPRQVKLGPSDFDALILMAADRMTGINEEGKNIPKISYEGMEVVKNDVDFIEFVE